MTAAPIPPHEQARLTELRRYAILDTPPEAAFGRVAALAARFFGTKMAAVSFVDELRQWNKACVGFRGDGVPRGASFCAHTVLQAEVLVVPDACADPRFRDYASVTGEPHVRFYAGAPLVTSAGYRLGSLCVFDTDPRPFTEADKETLADMAHLVVDELELRVALREAKALQREQDQKEAHIASIYEATQIGLCSVDEEGRFITANRAFCDLYGFEPGEIVGQSFTQVATTPQQAEAALTLHRDFLFGEAPYPEEWRVRRPGGGEFDVWVTAARVVSPDGRRYRVSTVTDLSERRGFELERSHLAGLIDQVSDAVVSTDLAFRVQSWSRGAQRLYGYTAAEATGRPFDSLVRTTFLDENVAEAFRDVSSQGRWSGEVEQRGKDDRALSVLSSVTLVRGAGGVPTGLVAVNRDLSQAKSLLKQLHHQANHDSLTGLPNRRLMRERLAEAKAGARREGRAAAFLLLDIDNFKGLNDTYGHLFGDELLRAVGARLRGCVREEDTLSRWGGDEFAVLAPRLQAGADAETIAETILDCFAAPLRVEGQELYVTLSIGLDTYSGDDRGTGDLFQNADMALYQVKAEGKGAYRVFSGELFERRAGRYRQEAAIRRGIETREFSLFYQPRVDLRTGAVTSVEALLRWPQADGTTALPGSFIPLAEETGLIYALGDLALEQAVVQAAAWQRQGTPRRVAVNLSAKQLRHPALVPTVRALLAAHGLAPQLLELEVTESIFVSDTDQSVEKLHALKTLGVYLSMDDFGTGYSSLAYLKRLPLDSLKLDRSFVCGLTGEGAAPKDASIVGAIVALARTLGLVVVAEGVETARQRHLLERLGCEQAQGYYFYKPLPVDELATVIAHASAAERPPPKLAKNT